MRGWLQVGLTLAAASGCTAQLPPVDPAALACEDDVALGSGLFPCPETHACVAGRCEPRLGCARTDLQDGCAPDERRCGLVRGAEVSRVTCERGLYTVTSTRAPDPEACGCPFASPNDDARLLCVAMAGPPQAGGYPLFVLPEGGGALPSAALGVPAEVPEWRWCVRPCSSDASCPVDHTCRPAAVLGPALAEDQGVGRHTVGVCYPNRLFVGTSSVVAPPPEPDPAVCISGPGCQEQPGVSTCQYRPERTPDHPYFPAGAAWSERWSLVGRCVDRGGLTPIGRGCTDGNAQACLTGICDGGFCARVCDPAQNDDPGCLCGPAEVVRSAGEARVRDLVNLCAAR